MNSNAIIGKELRDNLRWAGLGLLGLSAAYVWLLRQMIWLSSRDDLLRYDIAFAEEFWGITAVGSAIAGLLLGLAQILPENRGDRWGFLAHRPVNRSGTFFGKVVAGLILYGAVTLLPLAGAMTWISFPGHLPLPFDWRMTLPFVSDVLSGVAFYFAGLLIGMRDARWYLSRTMALGAAMVCTFLVASVRTFSWAVVDCSIGIGVIAIAAWGTFISGGRYETQPRLARIATTLAIGPGIAMVAGAIVLLVISFLPTQPDQTYVAYALSPEGQIVQTRNENGQILTVSDLSGQPIEQYKDPVARNSNFEGAVDAAQVRRYTPAIVARAYTYRGITPFFRPLHLRRTGGVGDVSWFYMFDARLIAGYDTRTARLVGWLGPDGYSEGAAQPSRRFEGDLQEPVGDFYYGPQSDLLAFPTSVYRLDLDHYRLQKVYTAASEEQILGAGRSSDAARRGNIETMPFDLIATTQKIVVQKPDGSPMLITSPDPLITGMGSLSVLRPLRAPDMPLFVWYSSMIAGEPEQVTEFNPAGGVVAQQSLPELNYRRPINWYEVTAESLVLPITLRVGFEVFTKIADRPPYGGRNVTVRRLGWILPAVAGLICAVIAFLRTRSYAFPSRRVLTWTLFAFATGPFGLLTMLMLLEWPAREKCPACGKPRVVTSERCEHCSQPFAPPTADGTEIFEIA